MPPPLTDSRKTEMESMIARASHVLKAASAPGVRGIPRYLFESCCGVVLIRSVSACFGMSGTVGTGIILAKHESTYGHWSYPCACAVTGTSIGVGMGATYQDVIVFIMDRSTLKNAASRLNLSLGGHVGFTLGVGRNASFSLGLKGGTVSVAFTVGAYAGASVDGGIVAVRPGVNASFYGRPVSSIDILNGNEEVQLPPGKGHVMDEVYAQLRWLSDKAQGNSGPFQPVPEFRESLRDILCEAKEKDSELAAAAAVEEHDSSKTDGGNDVKTKVEEEDDR